MILVKGFSQGKARSFATGKLDYFTTWTFIVSLLSNLPLISLPEIHVILFLCFFCTVVHDITQIILVPVYVSAIVGEQFRKSSLSRIILVLKATDFNILGCILREKKERFKCQHMLPFYYFCIVNSKTLKTSTRTTILSMFCFCSNHSARQ